MSLASSLHTIKGKQPCRRQSSLELCCRRDADKFSSDFRWVLYQGETNGGEGATRMLSRQNRAFFAKLTLITLT